jgi:hypothetical protein
MNLRNETYNSSTSGINMNAITSTVATVYEQLSSTLATAANASRNATMISAESSAPTPLKTIVLMALAATAGILAIGIFLERTWVRNHKFWQSEQQAARKANYSVADLTSEEADADTNNRLISPSV